MPDDLSKVHVTKGSTNILVDTKYLAFSPSELKLDESITVIDAKTYFKLSSGKQCKIKLRK